MTVEQQPRISPLSGWQQRFDAAAGIQPCVQLSEEPFLGQLNLRAAAGSGAEDAVAQVLGAPLPGEPCTWTAAGTVRLLWLGPNEWLLLTPGPTTALADALRQAIPDGSGAVTDVSAQRTTIRIRGGAASELLAKGTSIDLHPRRSPAGTCVQTLVAQTGIVLLVNDDTATDFTLLVRASFASYLAAWLVDATPRCP